MGVYIKNMELPKSCDVCPFMKTNDSLSCEDYRYMYCDFPNIGEFVTDYIASRHADCPLVEVKPHGRLIDADALSNDLMYDVELNSAALNSLEIANKKEREQLELDRDCKQNCARYVDDAPTVLEAEG